MMLSAVVPRSCSYEMKAFDKGHDKAREDLRRWDAEGKRRIGHSLNKAIKQNNDEGLPPMDTKVSRLALSIMGLVDDSIITDLNIEGPRPRHRLPTSHSNVEQMLLPDRVSCNSAPFLFLFDDLFNV